MADTHTHKYMHVYLLVSGTFTYLVETYDAAAAAVAAAC